jgi:hypothetical protein
MAEAASAEHVDLSSIAAAEGDLADDAFGLLDQDSARWRGGANVQASTH